MQISVYFYTRFSYNLISWRTLKVYPDSLHWITKKRWTEKQLYFVPYEITRDQSFALRITEQRSFH